MSCTALCISVSGCCHVLLARLSACCGVHTLHPASLVQHIIVELLSERSGLQDSLQRPLYLSRGTQDFIKDTVQIHDIVLAPKLELRSVSGSCKLPKFLKLRKSFTIFHATSPLQAIAEKLKNSSMRKQKQY